MGRITKSALIMFGMLLPAECWSAWDDPPWENTVQAITPSVNLNFGAPGVRQQVQLFLVNSNDPAGFHINFTFANKGKFLCGTREVPMTSVVLDVVSGTLGTGLAVPHDFSLVIDAGTGVATWSPTGTPTSATVNYLVAIYASWTDHSSSLAGFYQESIVPVIVSGP
jgi:hypothetical protein